MKSEPSLMERRLELEEFARYACLTNELVARVDLDKGMATYYRLEEDGFVRIEKKPWDAMDFVGILIPEEQKRWQVDGDWHIAMVKAIREGKTYRCQEHQRMPDGSLRYLMAMFQPTHDSTNHHAQYIYFRYDNTEEMLQEKWQREALKAAVENARQASRAKGDFLSNMSHEIRTPLNAIIGYLHILNDDKEQEGQRKAALKNSQLAADHLLSLINDILDMNTIGQGKMKVVSTSFQLTGIVEELQAVFHGQAASKRIELVCDTSALLVPDVLGDPLHVKQILMNILGNALKFTPEGGSVFFKVSQVLKEKTALTTFIIRDTGIGMTQEELSRLYRPFEQANANTRQRYGGTGLGLSISWNLVKLMHGSIRAESTPGEGTTFIVTIPLQPVLSCPVRRPTVAGKAFNPHGMRLLIAEDNEMNREIAEAILTEQGYVIDTAVNGQDAVQQFESNDPGTYQAILMDIQMPVMDGYAATRAIRHSSHEDAAKIPIIALSADVFDEDVAQAMASGMNDYVTKPIDVKKLHAALQKHISARQRK